MTSERANLIAFCSILVAICYLATIAALLAYEQRYAEALGFGGLTTGLVGVIGTFKPRSPSATASTDSGDVNVVPPEATPKE